MKRFICSEDDTETVDRVVHVITEIDVIYDGIEKHFLLQRAQSIMIGRVGAADDAGGEAGLRRELL